MDILRDSGICLSAQGPNSVITYEILGDDLALDFFRIDPNTGSITLQKSLLETGIKSFEVSSPLTLLP